MDRIGEEHGDCLELFSQNDMALLRCWCAQRLPANLLFNFGSFNSGLTVGLLFDVGLQTRGTPKRRNFILVFEMVSREGCWIQIQLCEI